MEAFTWQAWLTVGVVIAIAVALIREVARPDLIFLSGLGVLLLGGVVTPDQAFGGFSNSAVLTIGALFVVAAGVQQTEALGFLDRFLFARSRHLPTILPRLMLPTAALSAFMNNTPIVAIFTPRVQQWARQQGIPVSKLLIPLSYGAIIGGMVTLLGTSTNVVVSGLMVEAGRPALSMFDFTWIGVPVVLVVILYFGIVGYRLLPDRGHAPPVLEDGLKDCLFELRVSPRAPLVGQTVDEAGLRALGGAYLVHLRRDGRIVPASPGETMQAGDVLTFTGDAATLEMLVQRTGLDPVLQLPSSDALETLPLFEAIVADSSNLVGKSLRDVRFREQYGGVVLAIHRRSERVSGSLGRLSIKPGDLLLIEAGNGFDKRWNASRDEFYLVAPRRSVQAKPQPKKAPLALAILVAMIVLISTGVLSLVTAAFGAALAMVVTRCLNGTEARKSVNLQVLIIIAAALGIGQAVETSGLSIVIGGGIVNLAAAGGAVMVLVGLYLATNLLTEVFTNNAAAALMLPLALESAEQLGMEPKVLALAVAVAASASFMTPIGYQTNLMVMAAGGYRFKDYFRVGLPVSLIVMAVSITMLYLVWLN